MTITTRTGGPQGEQRERERTENCTALVGVGVHVAAGREKEKEDEEEEQSGSEESVRQKTEDTIEGERRERRGRIRRNAEAAKME